MTTEQKIRHLYLRAGFGLSPAEWGQMRKLSLKQAIDKLFEKTSAKPISMPEMYIPDEDEIQKMGKEKREELQKQAKRLTAKVNGDWLEKMISSDGSPLVEKMAMFWHGHFACEPKLFHLATQQVNMIRSLALGNFKDMVLAISKDAAMILYLNNQQNRKDRPNENYARELMELFTIGRGNYSEQDVKEAARAFTGWFCDKKTGAFQFKEKAHDNGNKTFMGKSGNFDGGDIVNMILAKKETAIFIARKLYRFFVNEMKAEEKRVAELADFFYKSNYDIAKTMRYLFEAEWFYEDGHAGAKIKSPIELLVGMAKVLKLKVENEEAWLFPQRALGQILFMPPNVAGWPGGKTWIDNSTLMLRLNFAGMIFEKADVAFKVKDSPKAAAKGQALKKMDLSADLSELQKAFGKLPADKIGQELATYLIPLSVKLDDEAFAKYVGSASTSEDKLKAWTLIIMSLPEFQLM